MKKLQCFEAHKTLLTEKSYDNLFPDDCNEPLIMKVLQHIHYVQSQIHATDLMDHAWKVRKKLCARYQDCAARV